MKTLSFFIAGIFSVITASAQYGRYNGIVTVTLNNPNERVYIDGRNYGNVGYNNAFQITDLRPGQHTIQVVNANNRGLLGGLFGGRNNAPTTAFNVMDGYDTQLTVRNNGRVQVRETRSTAYRNNRRYDRDRDYNRDYNYNR